LGKLVGPQNQYGHYEEEKNLTLAGNRTRAVQPVDCHYTNKINICGYVWYQSALLTLNSVKISSDFHSWIPESVRRAITMNNKKDLKVIVFSINAHCVIVLH
jgi:hypothetical protein